MRTRARDDEREARLLGDYSDAILRGERPDARGIDPADAALVRELHAFGQSIEPGPWLAPRSRATVARLAAEEQSARSPASPRDAAASRPGSGTRDDGGDDDEPAPRSFVSLDRPPPSIGAPATVERWRRPRLVAIAAGLALLVATASVFYLLTATWRDDPPPERTALAAAQPTLSAPGLAAEPTSTPTATAPPAVTATRTPVDLPTSTPRSLPASAPPPIPEAFLIYEAFTEPSTVPRRVEVRDTFARASIEVPWDGTGQVILSGCPDRLCDLVIDDRLYIQVTNAERAEEGLWIDDDGSSNTLPVVLTTRFRPGTNQVETALLDEQGDQRGVLTPVYIVILR